MLTEKNITRDSLEYKKFIKLYRSAFPRPERVPIRFLMKQDQAVVLCACYDGDMFCGFYSTLTFEDITHILFLAVDGDLRGKGYGSSILQLISQRYPKNRIILDIEAEDPTAKNQKQRLKRKAFYQKNGYRESGIEYNWRGVSYKILINNGKITTVEFDDFWENIFKARPHKSRNLLNTVEIFTKICYTIRMSKQQNEVSRACQADSQTEYDVRSGESDPGR